MSQCEATRQRDWEMPVLAGTDGKVAAAVLATTATAANVDLTSIPATPAGFSSFVQAVDPNPLGHYVTVQNDGPNDAFIVFGPTVGSVSGANVPAAATTGTNAVGLCMRVAAGSEKRLKLPSGPPTAVGANGGSPARFMGYVCKAAQTATLRVYQSSP